MLAGSQHHQGFGASSRLSATSWSCNDLQRTYLQSKVTLVLE
jgi:hypothetical protein